MKNKSKEGRKRETKEELDGENIWQKQSFQASTDFCDMLMVTFKDFLFTCHKSAQWHEETMTGQWRGSERMNPFNDHLWTVSTIEQRGHVNLRWTHSEHHRCVWLSVVTHWLLFSRIRNNVGVCWAHLLGNHFPLPLSQILLLLFYVLVNNWEPFSPMTSNRITSLPILY